MEIKLSILISSIPSRLVMMNNLYNRLLKEVGDLPIEVLCFIDNKKRSVGKKRESLVQLAKGEYLSFIDDDEDFFDGYATKIFEAIQYQTDVITFKQKVSLNGESFLVDFSLENPNEQTKTIAVGKYSDSHFFNLPEQDVSNIKYETILDNDKEVIVYNCFDSIYMNKSDTQIFLNTKSKRTFLTENKYANIKRLPFHVCAWKSEIAKSELFIDINYGEDWDWCKKLLLKTKTEFKINETLHHYIYDDNISEAKFTK
jgi:hypothetical protein